MPFSLHTVVPWGRSFAEYVRMFSLGEPEWRCRVLGCADGPASFNAEATRRGTTVVSCDPLYRYDESAIRDRIVATRDEVLEQTRQHASAFVWDVIDSVEQLGSVRTAAMDEFLDDYTRGRGQGRYVDASLPVLPFADKAFELGLCSHFLFLYSAHLDGDFHQAAVRELCRVAADVRIFPLVTLEGARSPFVESIQARLGTEGYRVTIERVGYEFQRGANQMMRIVAPHRPG